MGRLRKRDGAAEFQELNLPDDYLKNLSEHSTDEILSIVARVTAVMLRQLNLPEEEVEEFTGQVKERKMAVLFEHFKAVDIPAERKKVPFLACLCYTGLCVMRQGEW